MPRGERYNYGCSAGASPAVEKNSASRPWVDATVITMSICCFATRYVVYDSSDIA